MMFLDPTVIMKYFSFPAVTWVDVNQVVKPVSTTLILDKILE